MASTPWLTAIRVVPLYKPADIALLFKDLSAWWAVAGGWAIDCYIGSETRSHTDLDVVVLRGDAH